MAKKHTIPIILLLVITSVFSQTNTFKLGFTGCYPNNYDYFSTNNHPWSDYGDLNMNSWSAWWVGDNLTNNPQVHLPWAIEDLNTHNLYGYFQPDTIRISGYGKVVYHHAATHSYIPHFYYDYHNWGNDVPDNSQFGQGQYVYALLTENIGGDFNSELAALSGVHNNWMQSYCYYQDDPGYLLPFPYGPTGQQFANTYYIKPRMRISHDDAFGTEKNVVRVVVKAYSGDIIKDLTLTTLNFRKADGSYDGSYLEDYYQNIDLSVLGDEQHLNRGRVGGSQNQQEMTSGHCHVDYQIFWYGLVNVYIDYVKVMDEAAYELMLPNDNIYKIRTRIQAKVQSIKDHDANNMLKGFYMEETGIDNITCLRYLQNYLKAQFPNYPGARMNALYSPYPYQYNMKPDDWYSFHDAEQQFIDSVDPPIVLSELYPWQGYYNYGEVSLPDNIQSITLQSYYPQYFIDDVNWIYNQLSRVEKAPYNDFLQNHILSNYISNLRTVRDICFQNSRDTNNLT